jgi:hypothetical protein
MTTTKNTYTLGKIKQLVDLNGDSTNFELSFVVTCKEDTLFQVLVVDQTTLDNDPDLKYKDVTKTISGDIRADKNIYQNYFLILKSDTPCKVDVELTKKELPRTPDPVPEKPTKSIITKTLQDQDWTKMILIACGVIGAIVIMYCLLKPTNKGFSKNVSNTLYDYMPSSRPQAMSPIVSNSPMSMSPAISLPVASVSPTPSVSSLIGGSSNFGGSLLERLKRHAAI